MTDFKDKTIWITGASSGIGRAISRAVAGETVTLILTARNEEKLNETAMECRRRGAKTSILPLDLTDENSIMTVDETIVNRVDILIHCAGVSQRSLAFETKTGVNRELMEINFFS
ncbi:MAG: SDR family NAD(P)-dependent oxidoreductase, partial [Pyrinomonadaceae bacterium]